MTKAAVKAPQKAVKVDANQHPVKCPACGSGKNVVYCTTDQGKFRKRYRRCEGSRGKDRRCHTRWTTLEGFERIITSRRSNSIPKNKAA